MIRSGSETRKGALASSLDRLPTMLCLGWGAGALTMAMMSNIFNLLVLRYATDYLGIAAGVAGLMMAASKLYDAVADPTIGALSDRWKSPQGRRRPFMLVGAILCPIAILALFFVPAITGPALIAYYMVSLLLFATAYSLWNVPYLAMAAEMTDDYHDRSRLVSFRVNGGALGLLLSSIFGPWLLVWLGGGARGHQGMAIVMGGLILATALLCHRMTRTARFHEPSPKSELSYGEQFKLMARNRGLVVLLLQKAFWYFGFAANQASLAYFIKYVAGLSDYWLGVYYIILPIGMIAAQPLWLAIARRVEKKYASMLAMGTFGVIELSWLFTGPNEHWIFIVVRLLGLGVAAGGAILLIQSMFNDTIEYNYLTTGQRREGSFTGLFSLIEQSFAAFGVAALGGFLGWAGYISARGGVITEQPQTAVTAIAIAFAVVPFCTALISILCVSQYNVTKARLTELRAAHDAAN